MNVNKNRIACKANIGLCDQKKESGGEGIRRLGSMLRVLVPAVLISIALIACPDNATTTTTTPAGDTSAPSVSSPSFALSGTSATVTVSVNETGKLFWVAYDAGATGPVDAAALIVATGQAKTSPIVNSSGGSGQEVSAVGAQTIMVSGLSVGTSYDFYLVAQDAAGNNSGFTVLSIATAPDMSVPILTKGTVTFTSAMVNVSVSAIGELFWVAYASGTTAPANAAALITDSRATPDSTILAVSSGGQAAVAGAQIITISGLSIGTSYDFYLVAQDADNNNSPLSAKLVIDTTPDTTAPIVSSPSSTQGGTTAAINFSVNEIGKLFWIAYTDGATVPANAAALITAARQTPSGTTIAVSGSDGQTVAAVGPQTVMLTGLALDTSYDFYLIAQDAANNNSGFTSVSITTASVSDMTAPIVSGVSTSDITTTSATVNVSTDEVGKLFWAVYTTATPAPANAEALILAAAQTPVGMIIATSGVEGQMVAATGAQTVMVTGLSVAAVYDFYLVAQDMTGNNSVLSSSVITAAPDSTAPIVTNPNTSSTTDTVTISFSVNEPGRLFWVAYTDGATAPADATALMTAAGQTVADPIIARSGGSGTAFTTAGVQTVTIDTGLTAGTSYDFYLVAQDATGNNSPVISALDIVTTVSATAPVITDAVVRVGSVTSTSFGLNISVDKMSSLLWAIYASGATAPADAAAVIAAAGQAPSGAVIANSFGLVSQAVVVNGHFTITGLSGSDSYDVYLVARDATDAAIVSVVTKLVVITSSQFFLGANGVTVFCPNVAVGTPGDVTVGATTTTYTRRSIDTITADNAATTCTSDLLKMNGLFAGEATFDADISSWDVSSVADMSNMFNGAAVFNQNIGSWNVSSVTDTSNMFNGALAFDQDIGSWKVGSVTDASNMFSGAIVFDQNIGGWNVSNVTDMSNMFNSARAFDQNISGWDVSSVTNASSMFQFAGVFNQNIGSWNVSNVTNMSSMFGGALAFNQNIGSWKVDKVTSMSSMFATALVFDKDIGDWNVGSVTGMSGMFANAAAFDQDISDWNVSKVTDMSAMFGRAVAFDQDISDWNVSKVTSMKGMFDNATVFNQNISRWIVSGVTDMSRMFSAAAAFDADISSWVVSSVTDMSRMFSGAVAFDRNIGGWAVHNVTDMDSMFLSATVFNQNLSGWCVSGFDLPPLQFSTGSAITPASNNPQWGDTVSSCPVAVSSVTTVATTIGAGVSFTVNKIGKIFWVAYTDGTAAPANAAALVTAASGTVAGSIIASSGSGGQAVTAVGAQTVNITGLSPGPIRGAYRGHPDYRTIGTAYDVYLVAQDAGDNSYSILSFLDIATAPNCLTAFYDFIPGQGCRL